MDASIDSAPVTRISPGSFTRAYVENEAGEVELRLSRFGNWMVHIRPAGESQWRIACSGDLEAGALATEPAAYGLDTFVLGVLTIHRSGRRAFVRGREVALSIKEFQLLLHLSTDPHRVFGKDELLEGIWGSRSGQTRTLESHTSRLRRKLAAAGAPGLVINTWGTGYKLADRAPVDPSTTTPGGSGVRRLAPAS